MDATISGPVVASAVPTISTPEWKRWGCEVDADGQRVAGPGSLPSRHPGALHCPTAIQNLLSGASRRKASAAHGSASGSALSSQSASPWASVPVTPASTPATSDTETDYIAAGSRSRGGASEKKRSSWLGSMPASYWTSQRVPGFEGSSPPTKTYSVRNRQANSRAGSFSSSSSVSDRLPTLAGGENSRASDSSVERSAMALVPNAQFLGLMLLMILLISSPLIKVLSVLLFVVILVLDDA